MPFEIDVLFFMPFKIDVLFFMRFEIDVLFFFGPVQIIQSDITLQKIKITLIFHYQNQRRRGEGVVAGASFPEAAVASSSESGRRSGRSPFPERPR